MEKKSLQPRKVALPQVKKAVGLCGTKAEGCRDTHVSSGVQLQGCWYLMQHPMQARALSCTIELCALHTRPRQSNRLHVIARLPISGELGEVEQARSASYYRLASDRSKDAAAVLFRDAR